MKENRHFLVQHQGQPDQGRREADAHAELSPKQKWHQVGLRPAFADPDQELTLPAGDFGWFSVRWLRSDSVLKIKNSIREQ
mgnify:FL=1